jgi:hypothetical protein
MTLMIMAHLWSETVLILTMSAQTENALNFKNSYLFILFINVFTNCTFLETLGRVEYNDTLSFQLSQSLNYSNFK